MIGQSAPVSSLAAPTEPESGLPGVRVCMHLLGPGRTDGRVMREALALIEAGMAVTIVDTENDHSRPREETVQGVFVKHARTPTGWGPFKPWLLLKSFQMLGSLLTVLRTPAAVYHAHDITALPACYLAARLRRKRLVFDAHELPVTDPSITRRPLLCWVTAALLKGMMPRCDGVITVSPPIAPEMQRRYGGRLAVVVRNLPFYQPVKKSDRLRRLLQVGQDVRLALYQGNLQENRSLDKLVYAARFLAPNTIIVFMGKGESQPHLEALIKAEGVGDRVKIVPAVPYEELLGWTASADMGLTLFDPGWSLSIQMCLPNKLFEYLMAGLPILTSPLEAIVEIVQRYEVGRVVSSLAPEAIGQAINDLLADESARRQMGANALRASETELHWAVERQRLVQLYRGVVTASSSTLPSASRNGREEAYSPAALTGNDR